MPLTYHVGIHDEGFAYRVGDVWSETFPNHESALAAAKSAAARQQQGGEDAEISYQLSDGRWQTEHVSRGEGPITTVSDDEDNTLTDLTGSCRCGQVRLMVRGKPLRIGICHCTDCRQESGSAFTYFGLWPASEFHYEGVTSEFAGREFCPRCGSRVFALGKGEVEIKLGVLSEAPTRLRPSYEVWTKRREPWLSPIEGAEQYEEDRR